MQRHFIFLIGFFESNSNGLLQILFACVEALYAHGYSNDACRLAVELARDLLANPPDLKVEQPQTKVLKSTIGYSAYSRANARL